MTVLRVTGLWKSFGSQSVLTGVDLEVPQGSLTAVLGPSGSGKTTLLRVVAGFERGDRGSVTLGSGVVDDGHHYVPPEHRGIGYVPQEGSLFPHLTVRANVAFGVRGRRRRRRGPHAPATLSGGGGPVLPVDDLIDMVGLTGLGGRYPHQLSGGQQQRVALARALAVRPGLVLLDEPFSSLDAGLRSSVRADVQAVLRSRGTTAVLVTHDQDEALSVADQVAVVHAGRIDQCGTPQELYDHPSNPTLARFLGDANVVAATIQGDRVATPFGPLPWRVGPGMRVPQGAVTALVRPEQLRVETGDGPGMRARVARCEFHGHDTVVTVEPIAPLPAPGTPGGGEAIVGSGSVTVRSGGNLVLPDRAPVRITATGSVLTWPSAVRGSAR